MQNAYLTSFRGTGVGLSGFVAESDAGLDARIQAEIIAAAIDAIGAIPYPFRVTTSTCAHAEIVAAQTAISRVATTLDQDVRTLVRP
ncbi:MAG: hypothetical protein R3E12_09670 [Candidatus Eisenbacteria bacterium]